MKKLLSGVATVLLVSTAIGLYINQPSEKDTGKNSSIKATSTPKPKVDLIEAKTYE